MKRAEKQAVMRRGMLAESQGKATRRMLERGKTHRRLCTHREICIRRVRSAERRSSLSLLFAINGGEEWTLVSIRHPTSSSIADAGASEGTPAMMECHGERWQRDQRYS